MYHHRVDKSSSTSDHTQLSNVRSTPSTERPGSLDKSNVPAPLKGGDPAAASATATLLRLSPSHQSHSRRLPPKGLAQRLQALPTSMT